MQPNTPGQLHQFDQFELDDIKTLLQQGRSQEALPRLYKLASGYPDNQEIKGMLARLLAPTPQPQPTSPNNSSQPIPNQVQPPPTSVYNQYPSQLPNQNFYQPLPSSKGYYQPPPQQSMVFVPALASLWLKYFAACVLPAIAIIGCMFLVLDNMYNSYYTSSAERYNTTHSLNTTNNIIFITAAALVLSSAIWAAADAALARNRYGPGVFGAGRSYPLIVFVECILLWVIAFPLRLAYRERAQAYYGKR
jgi:hypothetical protein